MVDEQRARQTQKTAINIPAAPDVHAQATLLLTLVALVLSMREKLPLETSSMMVIAALTIGFTVFPYESGARRCMRSILTLAAILSAFDNNTPIVVLLLPVLISGSGHGPETHRHVRLLCASGDGQRCRHPVLEFRNPAPAAQPPEAFVIAVIFGANLGYATPLAHKINVLVMAAGGNTFGDFVKVGLPLAVIMWIAYTAALGFAYGL